jgi:hypothetical protein
MANGQSKYRKRKNTPSGKIHSSWFQHPDNLDKSGSARAIDKRAKFGTTTEKGKIKWRPHLFVHAGKMHYMHAQNLACL